MFAPSLKKSFLSSVLIKICFRKVPIPLYYTAFDYIGQAKTANKLR